MEPATIMNLIVAFLFVPQSHKAHKALMIKVEVFFVYFVALWDISFETASFLKAHIQVKETKIFPYTSIKQAKF
jgi:hypothetical protein